MPRVIWKFDVQKGPDVTTSVQIPKPAKIIGADVQVCDLKIWAIVDPEAEKVPIPVRCLGTGHEYARRELEGCKHIDTVKDSEYIWHLFAPGKFVK